MDLGLKIQKKKILEHDSASSRYYVCQFSDKTDNFDFPGTNLPKDGFWGCNFKNLSLDLQSGLLRHHVC